MSVEDSRLVILPKFTDGRGDLSFVESNIHIPFEIRRVYYLYNVPEGEGRGHHGHRKLQQLILPVSGSFNVLLNDGKNTKEYELNRPNIGLYVPPGMWRELTNFTTDAVCIVLASEYYDENDYFRDYDEFINYTKERL